MLVLPFLLALLQEPLDRSIALRQLPARVTSTTAINLGTAITFSPAQERWIPVGRLEFGDELDLNGDGDTQDQVLFVYDRRTGAFENLQLVVQGVPRFRGPLLPFGAYELPMQTDLNGDGDQLDEIVHVYDARDGSIRSTGVAAHRSTYRGVEDFLAVVGGTLLYLADEPDEGSDVNGDGDAVDRILRMLPFRPPGIAGGPVRTVGPPAPWPGLDGLVVSRLGSPVFQALRVAGPTVHVFLDEQLKGQDLNGDGDLADEVLHLVDGRTRAVSNTGLCGKVLETFGKYVVLRVYENDAEEDLNGDGDRWDHVPLVLDVLDGSVTSSRSAVRTSGTLRGFTSILGDTMLVQVDEKNQGFADLNGDGDLDDQVLHVLDLGTGMLANTGLDTGGNRIAGAGDRFLFTLDEADAGEIDLNGDGDTDDSVLHALSPSGLLNLVTAARVGGSSERLVTFAVNEASQGADFNFDGDIDDYVLGVYDAEPDVFRNTGISTSYNTTPGEVVGAKSLFSAWELHEGRDLNGDGDLVDVVAHVYDADTNVVTNLGLDGVGKLGTFPGVPDLVTLAVCELDQGNTDLNGDGDTEDDVLHLIELP